MSEEIKKTETKANNAAPAETGDQAGGKMFSQEDVNRIVSERLARERENRTAQQQYDERESALKAREAKFDCREFLDKEKYPAQLLDMLDTSDAEKFKELVNQLSDLFGYRRPRFVAPFTGSKGDGADQQNDLLRNAFKPQT